MTLLLQIDLSHVLLAALLYDEKCRAAEVRVQLDRVGANVCREVLLGDNLPHGVHEHCCAATSPVCGERGVHEARLDVDQHL